MFTFEILIKVPWYCYLIALLISVYYGVRAIIDLQAKYKAKESYLTSLNKTERIVIFYVQEFLFKFVTTISGFVAIFIDWNIFPSTAETNNISTGKALLLIFLFVWGVIGTGGYLTFLISTGKIIPPNK